jgi:hypothetical protein
VNQTLWTRHRLRNRVTRSLNTQPLHEAQSVGMNMEDRYAPLGLLIKHRVLSSSHRTSSLNFFNCSARVQFRRSLMFYP